AGFHPRMAGIKEALVTGASGFVGYHVSRLLVERGWRVRVFVRSTSPLFHLRELPNQVFHGDIQDVVALRAAMRGVGTVFHVTGHVSFQRRERAEIERVNVGGTQAVLEAATASDVETLIVTSSVAAVGGAKKWHSSDEDTPWDPSLDLQAYAGSKHRAERLALEASGGSLRVVAVNPSVVIGWPDARPSAGGRRIVEFLRGRVPGVIEWGFNCVDVRDVAEGHLLAYEKGKGGERYILGGENLRLQQFFALLAEISGRPEPRWRVPRPLAWTAALAHEIGSALRRRPAAFTRDMLRHTRRWGFYSSAKARRDLGYQPRPMRDTLAGAVRWFLDNGYARE
ncbi:MAG: SDR family oxidoreductase, partial [Acidobacteriota bacterium]